MFTGIKESQSHNSSVEWKSKRAIAIQERRTGRFLVPVTTFNGDIKVDGTFRVARGTRNFGSVKGQVSCYLLHRHNNDSH